MQDLRTGVFLEIDVVPNVKRNTFEINVKTLLPCDAFFV